ncbi:hypothetical protein F2P56_004558 [Juglans regia]|uniref:Uncharacterized protein n=1 Tax=Juglans regia TaxID=51240 RepID=A0A834D5T7_JUGRE|nr:hypothetical protein F2P56_004558 [Juglans regia]
MILNKSSTPITPRTGQFLAISAKGLIVMMAHVMRKRTRGGVIKGVSSGRLVQGHLEACKLKEYALVNNSRSSLLDSAHFVQPSLVEDYFTSDGKLVIGANTEVPLKGIEDIVHSGSTGVPIL